LSTDCCVVYDDSLLLCTTSASVPYHFQSVNLRYVLRKIKKQFKIVEDQYSLLALPKRSLERVLDVSMQGRARFRICVYGR